MQGQIITYKTAADGNVVWQEIKRELLCEIDLSREISDDELEEIIDKRLSVYGREHVLSLADREAYRRSIFNSLRKLDILSDLIESPDVTEIMVNGSSGIFYEKDGRLMRWDKGVLPPDKLSDIIQQIAGEANRSVNEAQPIMDARLSDGSRVNVVLSPVCVDGSSICIRKFTREPLTLERLIEWGSISAEAADFLKLMVRAGYNIFVSGGTGSGKTTFLNALSEYIPKDQRVVTIEDSAELNMSSIPNLVRLETRNANVNGAREISVRDLIRTALRMRPDRLIVGEVRGAEALDMLQAMNTGHDGSLSTGHANSCRDMMSRLETMVLMGMDLPIEAVQRQIVSAIDIIVHLGRLRDKSRKVIHIAEPAGIKNGEISLHSLYRFTEDKNDSGNVTGAWIREGALINREKLRREGLEKELEKVCEGPARQAAY